MTPYSQGIFAYQAGLSKNQNPYSAKSMDFILWEKGWNSADDHFKGR